MTENKVTVLLYKSIRYLLTFLGFISGSVSQVQYFQCGALNRDFVLITYIIFICWFQKPGISMFLIKTAMHFKRESYAFFHMKFWHNTWSNPLLLFGLKTNNQKSYFMGHGFKRHFVICALNKHRYCHSFLQCWFRLQFIALVTARMSLRFCSATLPSAKIFPSVL